MTKNLPTTAAVDCGYSYTKARTAYGSAMLPSIIGHAVAIAFETSMARVTNGCRLEVDGRDLFVGDLARLQSAIPSRPQDRQRDLQMVKALVIAALLSANAPPEINTLTTGLPVAWYLADRQALAETLTGRHRVKYNGRDVEITIHKTDVVPQPVGAVYDAVFSETARPTDPHRWARGKIAVVDIGDGTRDLILMDGMNYIGKLSKSYTTATAGQIKRLLARDIAERYQLELPLVEMDHVLQARTITLWGKEIDITDMVTAALNDATTTIISDANDLWKLRKTFSTVICCGGIAPVIFPHILKAFPSAFLPSNPQTTNVDGFYKRALVRTN